MVLQPCLQLIEYVKVYSPARTRRTHPAIRLPIHCIHPAMTAAKFFLRYTLVPFVAIVLVVVWAFNRESDEIDARQYAALVSAYPGFTPDLRGEVNRAMRDGKLAKSDYASIVRDSLNHGYVLDWSPTNVDLNTERGKLLGLVKRDARTPE